MAFTQADADTLRAAIASGTLEVTYQDKRIRYQDMTAMWAALAAIEAELAGATNGRVTVAATSRA